CRKPRAGRRGDRRSRSVRGGQQVAIGKREITVIGECTRGSSKWNARGSESGNNEVGGGSSARSGNRSRGCIRENRCCGRGGEVIRSGRCRACNHVARAIEC